MSLYSLPQVDLEAAPGVDVVPCPGVITDLVLRCGRGDGAALGVLFDLTHPLVAAIVGHGRPSCAAVDDLVVAAFARIWQQAPRYDPLDPTVPGVVAWLGDQAIDVGGRPPVVLAG